MTIIFLLCNFLILAGGVTKGIERVCNVLMPLLFVILIAFCINSFTMPKFQEGLSFLFRPDFSKITPSVLLGALGQAFFSLSLGLGCMMTYASYFSNNTRLGRTAVTTAMLDSLVAILAGVIIFPAVFSFGISPEAGPTLVFEVLPYIFNQLPGGAVWSSLFFLLLFLASLTSTVSMSEISITYFCEEKKMSRRKALTVSSLIALCGGLLCALSFGSVKHSETRRNDILRPFRLLLLQYLSAGGGHDMLCFHGMVYQKEHNSETDDRSREISIPHDRPACILS